MNIAIVSPWAISEASVGGTERFTVDLATQLSVLGNQVEVFVLSGKSCTIRGVKYTSLDLLGNEKTADEYDLQAFADNDKGNSFYAKWAAYLQENIDANKFDVIQLNSLLFADAWTNKPRILTIHTNPFEYELDWGRERFNCVAQKIQQDLPSKTVLVAPSEYYSRHFTKLFQRPVKTLPHAIDASRLSSGTSQALKVNHQSDSPDDGIAILLPSRLELIQKRPQIVFDGIALLPLHVRKRITVLATGRDSQYENNCTKLEQLAKLAGFKAQFTRFESMADAYALANIVALPSKSESFGYSALESLTFGLPTVLNNLPTFKEIGFGNDNAYFFDQTAHAFSETLLELLGNLQRHPTTEAWSARYEIRSWGSAYLELARTVVEHE